MDARPLTCPRCDATSAGTARFCAECAQDLRATVPANQHRSRRRLAAAVIDRLTRITAGFARLVLALAAGAVVFFTSQVAFALAGWANTSEWAPRLGVFVAACAAILTVGWRSEVLFQRHPQFCPHCGEPLRTVAPAADAPGRDPHEASTPPATDHGVRGTLDAIGHDAIILVGALLSGAIAAFIAYVLLDQIGLLGRLGRLTGDVDWLFACAGFALAVIAGTIAALTASTLPAVAEKNLAAVLESEVVFLDPHSTTANITRTFGYLAYDQVRADFGRLDIASPLFLALTYLGAPVMLLVLFAWPRLYRPLVRTPIRTLGTAMVVLSLIAGQGYAIQNVARWSACDPLYTVPSYPSRTASADFAFVDANLSGVEALDANGESVGRIVDLAGSLAGSSWLTLFPDRQRIAFDVSTKYADGSGPGADILTVDLDGSHLRVLVSGYPDILNQSPLIDPSGTSLYFLQIETVEENGVSRRNGSIERLDLSTKRCIRVAAADGVSDLALSPDGRTLAYVRFVDGDTRLWRVNTDGSDARPFFAGDDTWAGVTGPRFSPDGSSIAFSTESYEAHTVSVPPTCSCGSVRPFELFVAPSNGGGARAFAATDSMPFGRPTWSPDGTRIAFTDNFGWIEIVTVADGSVRTLTGRIVSPELLWMKNIER